MFNLGRPMPQIQVIILAAGAWARASMVDDYLAQWETVRAVRAPDEAPVTASCPDLVSRPVHTRPHSPP